MIPNILYSIGLVGCGVLGGLVAWKRGDTLLGIASLFMVFYGIDRACLVFLLSNRTRERDYYWRLNSDRVACAP